MSPLDHRIAALTDGELVAAVVALEPKILERSLSMDERLVRGMMLTEIERRYPQVCGPLNRWAGDATSTATYLEVLLEALPESVRP